MTVIHCTQKLLKELGNPALCDPVNLLSNSLESWYANLLRFHRKKCILFTNEKTLYSFLVPNVLKADLKKLETIFLINLSYNLKYEGFPPDVIKQFTQKHQEICFAKTTNRGVIGSMVDFAFQYSYYIETVEDINSILEINSKINTTPMGYLKYKYPIESLRCTLASNNGRNQ